MDLESALLADLERHGERLIALLGELVRFDTSNPPGGNEAPAQAWMAAHLRELGLVVDQWEVLPGRPNVVGLLPGAGGGRSVILNGHIDVAEVRQPDAWRRDPFEPQIDRGVMYGRGTSDMKSALAAYLFVLERLKSLGLRLLGTVIVESVIGEEAGEPGTRACVERGYLAEFAIVGEATRAGHLLASVGVMNCRITIQSPYTLHLHARRLALHAGGGVEGANVVEKMATRIIPALNDLEREWAVFKKHPAIPPAQTLINPFQIRGGGNPFFMPDRCVLDVVVLYLPGESKEAVQREVEDQVRRAAEADFWLRKYPPTIVWSPPEFPVEFLPADLDATHEGVRTLAAAATLVRGQPPEIGGSRGAITDAGALDAAGIPTVVFGPGDPYWIHRVDERVRVADVLVYAKTLALFLVRWCGIAS